MPVGSTGSHPHRAKAREWGFLGTRASRPQSCGRLLGARASRPLDRFAGLRPVAGGTPASVRTRRSQDADSRSRFREDMLSRE